MWPPSACSCASVLVLVGYAALMVLTYKTFNETPTGFIPSHDKGYLIVNVRLPDSASLARTQSTMNTIETLAVALPGVSHTVAIAGQSLLMGANAPNFGSMYVMLDEFHHRAGTDLSADHIAAQLKEIFDREVKDGEINILGAPPIDGLGTAGGFKIVIEDRGDAGLAALDTVSNEIVRQGNETPGLRDLFTSVRANTTWLYLDIDRAEVKAMDVSMSDVFNTLQVNFGSLYVNDFNRFGRTWQVNVQADARYRMQPDDLKRMYVPGRQGQMVPFSSFTKVREVAGPVMLVRYNLYSASFINADVAPGTSSGEAIERLQEVARRQPGPVDAGRVDRTGVFAAADGQYGHVRLFAGGGAGLPGLGRAVRKLVAAAGRDSGGADVPVVLCRGRDRGPHGHQYLYANRFRRARGPGVQERDFDRRVCPGETCLGRRPVRGHALGLPAPAAADRDDVAGFHLWRGAAGVE